MRLFSGVGLVLAALLALPHQANAQLLAPVQVAEPPASPLRVSHAPELSILARVENEPLRWQPWLAVAPLLGATLAFSFSGEVGEARWRGAGPIDSSFRAAVLHSGAGRRRAQRASDILMYSSIAAPVADALLWPAPEGATRGRTTYRLLTLDALSYAVSGLFIASTKRLIGRARPYAVDCNADSADARCDLSSRNESFISGHTATAFTGASLVCAHQRLRGHSVIGHLECITAMGMAAATGALRMAGEKHYISDVLAGAAVGILSGYVLPLLLYRAPAEPAPEDTIYVW
ncbi:MAG: phosphatase PAP2 family protein [Myxococcota bacterium]